MIEINILYHKQSDTFLADDLNGNVITFKADRVNNDVAQESTGKSLGPMVSLLMACGACSGIDIVMILEKQRQDFSELKIKVFGEREKDKTPAVWEKVKVEYYLKGDFDDAKAERAAELSIEKYCSVLETLRRAGASVEYEVILNQN
ncbi:OsmC family protein [Faecalibacter macacae]|uniref:OsmC family peroxiredoxin n=1 Tax=Faecalibacter macacae TaxID=1859289 RepID=A0A3L9MFM4_9FLAO|nr:OsmC family protein [Faecalibacter macacae]RLZ11840.1 OsmC family peroxiredoxin [Faecalibacter macacae]